MSYYCVCNYCGCKHLIWEESCPYCRRISELEAGNDQLKARELGFIQSLRELEAENTKLVALLRDAVHRIGTEGFDAKWQEAAKAALEVDNGAS